MKRLLLAVLAVTVVFLALEATGGFGLFTRSLFRVGKGIGGGHGPHIPFHRHLIFFAAAVVVAVALFALVRFTRAFAPRLSRAWRSANRSSDSSERRSP